VLTYHFLTNEVKAALVSKKSQLEQICFWNCALLAVLFPTFALQYHVPFRNEIEQRAPAPKMVCAGYASLFYGAWLW
jgi:hypothetical protein